MLILSGVGIIADLDRTLSCLSKWCKKTITEPKLHEMIFNATPIYLRGDGTELLADSETDAGIKLLKLDVIPNQRDSDALYLFFKRKRSSSVAGEVWSGTYVGTMDYLLTHILRERYQNSDESTGLKFITTKTLFKVYDSLLDKEHWATSAPRFSSPRLQHYLKHTLNFLRYFVGETTDGVIYNHTRTKVIFNTRLFGKFGEYLVMKADLTSEDQPYNLSLVSPKVLLKPQGFASEDRPEAFNIAGSMQKFVFDAVETDFDLRDPQRLHHTLVERQFRFIKPGKYMSELDLSLAARNSVKIATQIARTNPNYVHPMYNPDYNEIQFLIPFHLVFNILETPVCALVVRKQESGKWSLQTVLELSKAYENARIIKRPDELWLRMEVESDGVSLSGCSAATG